ncbi:AMP-binding protein [Staphylococcus edaphicus]|uniref:Putative long chain fatty acid-CoA ligase VraA n=1 Tax=Staphylococcus edaphicus TaxID=1955013 RepID=A0ABY4QB31_9STAP|nr:AMP-binding protein [Staphylococcus edaphicus]UQW81199.1 AMP-binding protein [Staphylococcus edaphicus]
MLQLLEKIEHYAQVQPDRYALDFGQDKRTYTQIAHKIRQHKERFKKVPKYSYVGLLLEDPLTTVEIYLTLLQQHCVPCILDFRWSQEQIDTLVDSYGIPFLITNDFTLIDTHKKQELLKWHEDLLHIGFTSGTTGLPKAYYRNEISWIYSYKETEKLMKKDVNTLIAPGPLSHSLSLYVCIFALYSGRHFIGQQTFNSQRLMTKIEQEKTGAPYALFVVPTMLVSCLTIHGEAKGFSYLFTTGDKLQSHVRHQVRNRFPHTQLIEFFGTSEASFISYNYNDEAPSASVGKLFPNVEVKLTQPDERGIGILKVNSNMVFSGYVSQRKVDNQWIDIGDFASMDEQNHLYLHGRQYDRMIIGGRNVYPTEIERVAQKFEVFNEVLVISAPHAKFGEIAILLYTGSHHVKHSVLKAFLIKRLARYQIPSKILKVEQMQYTQSGKIARETMKKRYLKGEL